MTTQVTISLSDELYQGVANFAQLLGKDIREVLSETIELSLAPILTQNQVPPAVTELSDRELLTLTELTLEPQTDIRLSQLLERQQEGLITLPEQSELLGLMQNYQEGWLQKTQAIVEAVKRGLRQPLSA